MPYIDVIVRNTNGEDVTKTVSPQTLVQKVAGVDASDGSYRIEQRDKIADFFQGILNSDANSIHAGFLTVHVSQFDDTVASVLVDDVTQTTLTAEEWVANGLIVYPDSYTDQGLTCIIANLSDKKIQLQIPSNTGFAGGTCVLRPMAKIEQLYSPDYFTLEHPLYAEPLELLQILPFVSQVGLSDTNVARGQYLSRLDELMVLKVDQSTFLFQDLLSDDDIILYGLTRTGAKHESIVLSFQDNSLTFSWTLPLKRYLISMASKYYLPTKGGHIAADAAGFASWLHGYYPSPRERFAFNSGILSYSAVLGEAEYVEPEINCEGVSDISNCIQLDGTWDIKIDGEVVGTNLDVAAVQAYFNNSPEFELRDCLPPPVISCDGAIDTSNCMELEGEFHIEIDGELVGEDLTQTQVEAFFAQHPDFETEECGSAEISCAGAIESSNCMVLDGLYDIEVDGTIVATDQTDTQVRAYFESRSDVVVEDCLAGNGECDGATPHAVLNVGGYQTTQPTYTLNIDDEDELFTNLTQEQLVDKLRALGYSVDIFYKPR